MKNLGIDDFSSKKREVFNTIFVDNDNKKKVEVIHSREKDDVVKTLKLFTKVKTITRDFSQTYKNAINEALPQAIQIVDRFHILKNLTDDLNDYLKRNIADRTQMIDKKGKAGIEEEIILNRRQKNKRESAERKWEVIQEARMNIKYLKRSKIKQLLFRNIEEIKDENTKKSLEEYLKTNHELNTIVNMLRRFKEIIFSKKPRRLNKWIKDAKKINVKELNSFVTLIESDIDAVKNAIKYDYSNGLTEGFNNKTKVIKRIMYGRCSFDLLLLKILV